MKRWYITIAAAENYARIVKRSITVEQATAELEERAPEATRRAELGDLELYRSPRKHSKMRWLVSHARRPEGTLPQVIWVGNGAPPRKWWPADE